MSLISFRELLLRKTADESLRTLLEYSSDEVLATRVLESLEKMARHRGKDSKPNAVLGDFINRYGQDHRDAVDVGADQPAVGHWLRDQLGHHASRYQTAIGSGNDKVANEHASRYTKVLRLLDKMERAHALDSPVSFEAAPYQAWQRHAGDTQFRDAKKASGHDLPGWKNHDQNDKRKDFSWMRNPPHPEHKDTASHLTAGNAGSYPMEATKVNGRYVPIEDTEPSGTVVPHSMDSHPIWGYMDKPSTSLTPSDVANYNRSLASFHASPEHTRLSDKLEMLMAPEHGSVKGPGAPLKSDTASPVPTPEVKEVSAPSANIDESKIPQHLRHLLKE